MRNYQDIIHAKRYICPDRAAMSQQDRAAQFSAFAALTGFDGVIAETGRLTDNFPELDEHAKAAIDEKLAQLADSISEKPMVSLVWFRPDEKKTGGAYVTYTGQLKKIDAYERVLTFKDGTQIPIDNLCHIQKSDP